MRNNQQTVETKICREESKVEQEVCTSPSVCTYRHDFVYVLLYMLLLFDLVSSECYTCTIFSPKLDPMATAIFQQDLPAMIFKFADYAKCKSSITSAFSPAQDVFSLFGLVILQTLPSYCMAFRCHSGL